MCAALPFLPKCKNNSVDNPPQVVDRWNGWPPTIAPTSTRNPSVGARKDCGSVRRAGGEQLKKLAASAALLAAVLVGSAPALAQVPVEMVDCVIGSPCIGTSDNDTISGSGQEDVIFGLEGDGVIDAGNDAGMD